VDGFPCGDDAKAVNFSSHCDHEMTRIVVSSEGVCGAKDRVHQDLGAEWPYSDLSVPRCHDLGGKPQRPTAPAKCPFCSQDLLCHGRCIASTRRINITRFLHRYDAALCPFPQSYIHPILHLLTNMSLRNRVDHVVDGLQSASHFWSASRAPLDNGGGRPLPPLLNRSLEEIKNIVDEGAPFTPADLVGAGLLLRVACGSSVSSLIIDSLHTLML
jgi:hypothetical protein